MDKIMELISSKHAKILAVILCVALVVSLVCCSGNQDTEKETQTEPTDILVETPSDPPAEMPTEAPTEPAPVVRVTMGTVITGVLNVRKGPESGYEKVDTYKMGDRIEILETKTQSDGTRWGRTNLGWVGMGYVRMDGVDVPTTAAGDPSTKIVSDGNSTVLGYGIVTLGELNVRMGPGTNNAKIASVTIYNRYAYYQLQDGWARIESGWVSTDYFYVEGTSRDSAMTAAVTEESLNIRTGPDTKFQSVGTYTKGEQIQILAQVDLWGYTDKGWVYLAYVEEAVPTYTTGAGRVTIGLNIRKEPNAESELVGTYTEGDLITILEVDGGWGKTDKGWINLKYIEFS